jgi:hypothetical protein
MRRFYLSLGMRKETLERTLEIARTPPRPVARAAKPPNRANRGKAA